MRPFKATLHLKSYAAPGFHKPRSVPFASKEAVGRELDEMEAARVLERVTHTRWAAPILCLCPRKMDRFTSVVISRLP